jgi:outer membrane protein assembly factor BamB
LKTAKRITLSAVAILTTAAIVFVCRAQEELRTWTDSSGKYKIKAEFVEVDGDDVVLNKEEGGEARIPLSRLSKADQKWISNLLNPQSAEVTANNVDKAQKADTNAQFISTDWPRWRGVNNDAISVETGLLKSWPQDGPPLMWSTDGLGDGFSSVAIFEEKLYTMGRKDGQTKLICRSLDGGAPIWETNVGEGDRPNCTPTVDPASKLVFGISHAGDLLCADAETGKEVWRKNFDRDFGGSMMSGWGYSESPLVDGDLLICTPGSDKAVMAALEKRTGKVVWTAPMEGGRAGYASPVISYGGGVKQYVTLVGKGLISVRAENGEPLWHYPRIANGTANIPTPIVKDDYIFTSSGYNDGGTALLRLKKSGSGVRFEEVYYLPNNKLQNHHGGMVLIGDYVYMGHGHNEGKPVCVELKTGKIVWGPVRGPGGNSAAVVAADGKLYFRYQDGQMGLIDANSQGYQLDGSFRIKTVHGESWAHPVISNKRLYLRDQNDLHCYDIAAESAK